MGIIWSFFFAAAVAPSPTQNPLTAAPDLLRVNDVGKLAISKESRTAAANNLELFQALLKELEVFCEDDQGHITNQTAMLYQTRFRTLDNPDDLEASLKFMHASVSAEPDNPRYLQGLSMSYNDRFHRLDRLEDLESALNYMNAALDMLLPDSPDSATYQHSLALIYMQQFRRLDDVDALKSAIRVMELAVVSSTQSHPDYAARLMLLATIYGWRFMRFKERKDATSGVEYLKLAIAATPLGDRDLPGRLLNLSKFHTLLSTNYSSLMDLELAIKYGEAAVACSHPARPDIAVFLSSLASLYGNRFQWLGDLLDLRCSVRHAQAASPPRPRTFPISQVSILPPQSAVSHARRSVEITPKDHPNLALRKQHLAIAHLKCFRALNEITDLDEALGILQSVNEHMQEDHPQRPEISYWIAECRRSRYEHLKDRHELTLAIQYGLLSASLLSPEDSRRADYEQFIAQLFGEAFNVSMEVDDLNCALYYFRSASHSRTTVPPISWDSAVHWAELCRKHHLPECLEAYSKAVAVLTDLIWLVSPIVVWHEALVRLNIPTVIVTSVAASLDFHQPELSVEFLEQGLAITYKQLLQQREESTELAAQYPELAQGFTEHSFRMRQAVSERSAPDAGLENRNVLALEHKKMVQEIRMLPGFETFFLPSRYHTLRAAAQNGPVIMLNNTLERSDAIIILAPQLPVQHIQLQASYEDLESQVQQLRVGLSMCKIRSRQNPRRGQDEGTAQTILQGIMAWSWDTVVSPIFQILHANGIHDGRLWWCPTGLFTQLPLHAAAPLDHNIYVQSYTPTLDVLLKATARYNTARTVQHRTGYRPTLTIVAVPELSPNHHLKDWENIPGALVEVDHIKSVVGPDKIKVLSGKDATCAAVASALTNPSWVHFACHGEQYAHEPLKSRLVLYDKELTLEEILRLRPRNPEFAFLSACETAMGDATLANESMHLAGGLIAAGFCGVIGTLWAVADDDSALVTKGVYRRLFKPTDTGPDIAQAAYALHAVVGVMRKQNIGFHRWMSLVHMGV